MNNGSVTPGEGCRGDFPLLSRQREDGIGYTYLDSAATALKPKPVIDAVCKVLSFHTANVHRSVYEIGDEATDIYEGARETVARFINADPHEVIFVRNTTEALNLLAHAWRRSGAVVTSYGEHHSNLLGWGDDIIRLNPLPDGSPDLKQLERTLDSENVGMVTLSHASNVTGTMIDPRPIADMVHDAGALFTLDGAQSVPHHRIDVKALGCDFLAFSGHKMCAPTGIGVLYGKAEHLARLDWFLRGGQTVDQVHLDNTVAKQPPWKFEAGTPPVEAAAGLAAAIDYLESVGITSIEEHVVDLTRYTLKALSAHLPQVRIFGPTDNTRVGPVSLQLENVSPHVIARGLSDGYGICLRSGYHCAQPLHEILNSPPTLRASFYLYNTRHEVDTFVSALADILSFHEGGIL